MRAGAERRAAVFPALRSLLMERPWGEVTLESVAKEAGVSRQTLYNAFGSRYGLAQAYTLDLAEALCDLAVDALAQHPGDPRAGLEAALRTYLAVVDTDPLIHRVRAGEAHHDLMQIVTTDAGPLLRYVAGRLEAAVRPAWGEVDDATASAIGRTFARIALSYVTTPSETDEDVVPGMAALLAP